jgi:membrane-bound serine protease (ClpP class)
MTEMALGAIICLYVGGLLAIVIEMFVPGGILGIFGGIAMTVAVIFGFQHSFAAGLILLILGIVLVPTSLVTAMKYAPQMPFSKKLFLHESLDADKGYSSAEKGLEELMNRTGIADTNLRPAGIAEIDGKRTDVVTDGEMIDKGTEIKVIEVEGNRVVVQAKNA